MSAGAELRIGEAARLAGTTPRTIRYYEEIGLLPVAAGRQPGAHRTYAEPDVERLTELLRLKDLLGLSLEELKELVEAEGARAELRREWQGGVEDPVRRRRDEIKKLEDELTKRRTRARSLLSALKSDPATHK